MFPYWQEVVDEITSYGASVRIDRSGASVTIPDSVSRIDAVRVATLSRDIYDYVSADPVIYTHPTDDCIIIEISPD